MKHENILLVDDDKNFLRVLSYQVRELGFRVSGAGSAKEGLELLERERFDLVITDLRMPEIDGISFLKQVKKPHPDLPVIVLTAHGSIEAAVAALKSGAFDFLTKPCDKEEVRNTIANALRMADLVEENRRLAAVVQEKFEFKGITGSSRAFQDVLELAAQLSQVGTTVLIQGESGTGKEVVARAIHFNSERRSRPFVVVNCGAIPQELIESELFGHKKGAFTGAVGDRKGKFETADTGTLFLDEVSELPLNMQVRLLRVVQEREIDTVGDPKPRPVDVRIIAATNRDLEQEVHEGRFREDLYYRLAVAPLWLPPLRSRPEDIPELIFHFLNKVNEKFGKKVAFEPEAVEALQLHAWRGNVRELENMVERLVVFNQSGEVSRKDLPPHIRGLAPRLGRVIFQLPEDGFSLEELERDLLLEALKKHDWNQTHAANYLRITRQTLLYRMQKFELRSHEQPQALQPQA